MVLPASPWGAEIPKTEQFNESGYLAEVIPLRLPEADQIELISIMIKDIKRKSESLDDDELSFICADNLTGMAEVLSGYNLHCLETVDQLKGYLYDDDGKLWLEPTLRRSNPYFKPIEFRQTHLVTSLTTDGFMFSACQIELCVNLGAHHTTDTLTLPLNESQPPKLISGGKLISLSPRASQDFGVGVRNYGEVLGQIFATLHDKFLQDQDPYAWG